MEGSETLQFDNYWMREEFFFRTCSQSDKECLKHHLWPVLRLRLSSKSYVPSIWDEASKCGDLAFIQWLHDNNIQGCSKHTIDLAVKSRNLDVAMFLHENR